MVIGARPGRTGHDVDDRRGELGSQPAQLIDGIDAAIEWLRRRQHLGEQQPEAAHIVGRPRAFSDGDGDGEVGDVRGSGGVEQDVTAHNSPCVTP